MPLYRALSLVALSLIAGTACATEYSSVDLSHEYAKDKQAFIEQHQEESDFVVHGVFKRLDVNIDGQVMQIFGLPSEELNDEYDPLGSIQLNPVSTEDKQLRAFKEDDRVTANCKGLDASMGMLMFKECTFTPEQ